MWPHAEALFVALVLVPTSYPRNRFFEMYRTPGARRARRRAAKVRSILMELSSWASDVSVSPWGGGFELSYTMRELVAVRRVRVDALELALLAALLRRTAAASSIVVPLFVAAGEPALEALAPVLARLLGPR